jgi:L-alanine-DL-glutamate epimerase-like enolase superfamily enzyme
MARIGCRALIMEGEMRSERAEEPWRYGGYSKRHVERLFALANEGLVDVLNLDLGIVGFSNWPRIMPELRRAGLAASPHTWRWTPRPCYVGHLGAGLGNVVTIEGIPGRAKGVDYSAYRIEEGRLVVPDVPGFGLALEAE